MSETEYTKLNILVLGGFFLMAVENQEEQLIF